MDKYSPDFRRTIKYLFIVALLLAVPLTVYIAQQQQEVRQFAAGESSDSGGVDSDSSDSGGACTQNGCSCRVNSDCDSNRCYIGSNNRGVCAAPNCNSTKGKPATCACTNNSDCASNQCRNRKCNGGPSILPTATPTPNVPTPTPTTRPGVTNTPTPTPTGTQGGLSADVDRNGCIDIRDFNEWVFAIQNNGTPRQTTYRPDINGDSTVDILDFNEWFNAMRSGQNLCSS